MSSGCGYAPFRSSLCAYLSRFPAESVNHFMNTDRLRNPKYVRLFLAILELPEAEVLRAELKSKKNVDKIVERLFLLSITSSENTTVISSNLEAGGVNGDGMHTISIAPKVPDPSALDLEIVRREMDVAQENLKKVRKYYDQQREGLRRLRYDAERSMKNKMKNIRMRRSSTIVTQKLNIAIN